MVSFKGSEEFSLFLKEKISIELEGKVLIFWVCMNSQGGLQ